MFVVSPVYGFSVVLAVQVLTERKCWRLIERRLAEVLRLKKLKKLKSL